MVLQRHKLVEFSETGTGFFVLVVNPKKLEPVFSISSLSRSLQRLFQLLPVVPFHLQLPAKNTLLPQSLMRDGSILLRLPHSKEEQLYMQSLTDAEVWEISQDEYEQHILENEGRIGVVGGTADERQVAQELIKQNAKKSTLSEKIRGTIGLVFPFLSVVRTYVPFPLFRAKEVVVCDRSKASVFDEILELARKRYVASQENETVGSKYISFSSITDYKETELTATHREFYRHASLQLLEDSAAAGSLASSLFGYEVGNRYSGIDILSGIVNRIGQQSLPYTIYLLGGNGNTPFKIREYFCAIYPGIALQFVGISAPQGELTEASYVAIKSDIQEKHPDLLFVSVGRASSVQVIKQLTADHVDFGIALALGESFNRFVTSKRTKENPIVKTKQYIQELQSIAAVLKV
jgi:UDP-N-acetyl-D-mannosaminuronic acid transferase (WecB/TagA/CpsF family)